MLTMLCSFPFIFLDTMFNTLCQPPGGPCLRYQPYKAMKIPCNNPSSGTMIESCVVRYQPHRTTIKNENYSPPETLVEPPITLSLPNLHTASNSFTPSTSCKRVMILWIHVKRKCHTNKCRKGFLIGVNSG